MEIDKKRCIGNDFKLFLYAYIDITIVTGSGNVSIVKQTIGVFKAILSSGLIKWIRTV